MILTANRPFDTIPAMVDYYTRNPLAVAGRPAVFLMFACKRP